MIKLRAEYPEYAPVYKTLYASAADIYCVEDTPLLFDAGTVLVPTGLYIEGVDEQILAGAVHLIPELQIRARSSLARDGIVLANGIGTIDCDYTKEIRVPLLNLTGNDIIIRKGERIAQITLGLRPRLPGVTVEGVERTGGFGSTGKSDTESDIILPPNAGKIIT